MLRYDSVRDHIAVAPQRLADAYELLEQPTWEGDAHNAGHRHLRAAVYLAGYAVECALKAYIITMESDGRRHRDLTLNDVIAVRCGRGEKIDLSGRRGHNLTLLLRATDLAPVMHADDEIKKRWGIVRKWRTDWRYHPKPYTSRGDARAFVHAAATLHSWVDALRSSTEEASHGSD